LPLEHRSRVSQRALRFALSMSPDVIAVHIDSDETDGCLSREDWYKYVEEPSRQANVAVPRLVTLKSRTAM
jgi:hypothetical protein